MLELMFRALPAFVEYEEGNVLYIWCSHNKPATKPNKTDCIRLDFDKLSLTNALKGGLIPQFDDPENWAAGGTASGLTGIWPGKPDPQDSLYYAEAYPSPTADGCANLGNWQIPKDPSGSSDDRIEQYQCLIQISGSSTRRFHGFRAKVKSAPSGGIVVVDLYKANNPDPRWTDVTINLDDHDLCHPGYTTLNSSSKMDDMGAVFLSDSPAPDTLDLEIPKLPPSYGNRAWP